MTEVNVNYSLFATDNGEYFAGSCQLTIEDFADFISGELKDAIIKLLNNNPYKVFSLVMDCDKAEIEIHGSVTSEKND